MAFVLLILWQYSFNAAYNSSWVGISGSPSMKIKAPVLVILFVIQSTSLYAATSDHFVTTWKTNNPGTSNDTSITIPMIGGPYDVDWNNDGTFDEFGLANSSRHDYGVAGIYTIRIRGTYDAIQFNNGGDRKKILSLDQWGTNQWTTMANAF